MGRPRSTAAKLGTDARDWLATFIVEMAAVAERKGDTGNRHPCRKIARHAIQHWALWHWTASGERDGVVVSNSRKYAADLREQPRRSKNDHLHHHHDRPRAQLTDEIIALVRSGKAGRSKKRVIREVRQYLEKHCTARVLTRQAHKAHHDEERKLKAK